MCWPPRTNPNRSASPTLATIARACAFFVTLAALAGAPQESHAAPADGVGVGLLVASPALLDPSLGSGIQASWAPTVLLRRGGLRVDVGGVLAWLGASEDTLGWQVDHDELRAAATLEGRWRRGRGALLMQLGVGGTLVWEGRERHQSRRLAGGPLTTSGSALLGQGSAQLGAQVRLVRELWLALRVGPTLHLGAGGGAGYGGVLEVRWLAD